ncbi:MAG: type II secretion system protein N [Burkholderiales bacterium]
MTAPASLHWPESTYTQQSWEHARAASMRWALAGALVGALIGLIAFAPATWLAGAVASASGERLLLADARGTVWSGSAVPVLTGGPGSRDAAALPGRLTWTLAWRGTALEVRATQACCLNGALTVRVSPGLSRLTITLVPPPGWIGQWPSAWLGGLGTPWNTLQLGGSLRLLSPGFSIERIAGRWRVDGALDIELINASSRLSTLETLGTYRLRLVGDPANAGQPTIALTTQDGALELSGNGSWGPGGVRFRGEARAAPDDETALSNLLNIIGRRDGARSVISIG